MALVIGLAIQQKKNEKNALADPYNKAIRFIYNAKAGGGILGSAAGSFESRTGKPGDRVDFVIAGSINLIP